MFAPDHFTSKDMVLRSLENMLKTVIETPDLNTVRIRLQTGLQNVISWESQLLNAPEEK